MKRLTPERIGRLRTLAETCSLREILATGEFGDMRSENNLRASAYKHGIRFKRLRPNLGHHEWDDPCTDEEMARRCAAVRAERPPLPDWSADDAVNRTHVYLAPKVYC